MNLLDLIGRSPIPQPWDEGDNIPWDDPAFSARMLKEHLDQAHDAASRRFEKIDKQVSWIHHNILDARPSRILDLGCGPGLYTQRLAALGHECVGIDYSPASIAYAADEAEKGHLHCTYVRDDMRAAEFGADFDLIMLLYGEFNTFSTLDAQAIVRKASHALSPDGQLLLEPHTFTAIQKRGLSGTSWYSAKSGLFSDRPHLCLQESFWDEQARAATIRYFVIDAATRSVTPYAASYQAYATEGYEDILRRRGLDEVEFFPSLLGVKDPTQGDFLVIVAREGTEANL